MIGVIRYDEFGEAVSTPESNEANRVMSVTL